MLFYSYNKLSLETPLPLYLPKTPGMEEDGKTHSYHRCRLEVDTKFINGDQRWKTVEFTASGETHIYYRIDNRYTLRHTEKENVRG